MIPVVEIFGPTTQGEGPNVGARCIFVRVKGCTYACEWCDSKFTWNSSSYESIEYAPADLASKIQSLCEENNCSRVVLTGGNPCMYDFSEVLLRLNHYIAFDIETQGDLTPDWLKLVSTVVFSPKAPSSKMPDTFNQITSYIVDVAPKSQQIAIKIPVFNDEDVEFAKKYAKFVNSLTGPYDNNLKLYLSVGNSDVEETGQIRDRVLSDYEKLINKLNKNPDDFNNVFILPQLHTLVWGNKQGV